MEFNIYNLAEEDKRKWLDDVRSKLFCDYIVVYGAGTRAKAIYLALQENEIAVHCFCVSEGKSHKLNMYDLPVFEVMDITFPKEKTLFILAMNEKYNEGIQKDLEGGGYKYIIPSPKYALHFDGKKSKDIFRPLIDVTTKVGCPIACRYCPQSLFLNRYYAAHEVGEMSSQNFEICVDKLPQDTIIQFAGFSEPFLNPACTDMLCYAAERGRDIYLFTTLVGMTKETFHRIKDIPFKEVTLHTPDANQYANIPMTQEYFELLEIVLDEKKGDGTPFIDRANCQSEPHEDIKKYTKNKVEFSSFLNTRGGNLDTAEGLEEKKNLKGMIVCEDAVNLNHNELLPDGTMCLCSQDFGLEHELGNLLKQSYEEIMCGTILSQIKRNRQEENGECRLCRNCSKAHVIRS